MTSTQKRPAHRPSRKALIVEAAMQLCASQSPSAVTVADIAEEAGMTSAAVYYHYPSKDDILLEGLRKFGTLLVEAARRCQLQISRGGDLGDLPISLLRWVGDNRDDATVYFVYSAGMNPTVESLRRDNRSDLVTIFSRTARATAARLAPAAAAVVGAALLSLFETATVSMLTEDTTFSELGMPEFLDQSAKLARRIAGQ